MTNNIGGINGYGYGIGGGYFAPKRNEDEKQAQAQAQAQEQVPNYEETQVDPQKVMDFLASNSYMVNFANSAAPVDGVETDPTIADRVAGYMENYDFIMGIIEQEFGEDLAPAVMDVVMDRLMGMV